LDVKLKAASEKNRMCLVGLSTEMWRKGIDTETAESYSLKRWRNTGIQAGGMVTEMSRAMQIKGAGIDLK